MEELRVRDVMTSDATTLKRNEKPIPQSLILEDSVKKPIEIRKPRTNDKLYRRVDLPLLGVAEVPVRDGLD
jgi:hypothetical protein